MNIFCAFFGTPQSEENSPFTEIRVLQLNLLVQGSFVVPNSQWCIL